MHNQFLDIPWTIWGIFCVIIGIVYTLLWPRAAKGMQRTFWQQFIIRWFHGLVWFILGISCFIRINPQNAHPSNLLALLGLVMYMIFIGNLIYERITYRKKHHDVK